MSFSGGVPRPSSVLLAETINDDNDDKYLKIIFALKPASLYTHMHCMSLVLRPNTPKICKMVVVVMVIVVVVAAAASKTLDDDDDDDDDEDTFFPCSPSKANK
jgi:hypothetical protein